VILVGFDITPEQVLADDKTWFVIAENPTGPRFGLDNAPAHPAQPPVSRNDLAWPDLLGPGAPPFLRAADPQRLVGEDPEAGETDKTAKSWGQNAATVAHILFQNPARAAFKGAQMIEHGGGNA
jgi:hypothetical protein